MGFEDEVVINLVISELEQTDINTPLCPKKMQINLTGFLEQNAAVFMKELWNLLLVSQRSEGGIVLSIYYYRNRLRTSSRRRRPSSSDARLKSR